MNSCFTGYRNEVPKGRVGLQMKNEIPKEVLCSRCGRNPAQFPHECPFAAEINENNDPEFCDCCEECIDNCRDYI